MYSNSALHEFYNNLLTIYTANAARAKFNWINLILYLKTFFKTNKTEKK